MLSSYVYGKQKILKYKIASHLGLGGSVVSSGHSTLRPQGVQCGGAFMSLDPAAREERTSAQITTCAYTRAAGGFVLLSLYRKKLFFVICASVIL